MCYRLHMERVCGGHGQQSSKHATSSQYLLFLYKENDQPNHNRYLGLRQKPATDGWVVKSDIL